jgi:AAA+ ATPase superfamily predicted ATPase
VLFDERPKSARRELFDREKELNELLRNVNRPITLLTGIRRIGKTSVLNVFLSESKIPSIIVDARTLKRNYGRSDLYRIFAKGISSNIDSLRDVISKVKRVRILGNEIEFSWKGKDYISLSELFDGLNEKRVIIAIDEAQLLRGPNSEEIKNAIAHSYDYNRNISFILTGSEVGLLYEFFGVEDVDSPLYGRYFFELKLERFDRRKSIDFLRKGFEEAGMDVDSSIIEEAVLEFDGIVGWLAYFGNRWINGTRNMNQIREMAISLAKEEIKKLCEGRSSRLQTVLKCLAEGKDSWSKLKNCIEEKEGGIISSSILDNLIRTLERLSIVKDYTFLDPVYMKAAKSF